MADYKSASDKQKGLEALKNRQIQSSVQATVKKKNGIDKIKDKVRSTNAVQTVIIPTIKRTFFDVLHMIMFNGERAPGINSYGQPKGSVNISYNGYYQKPQPKPRALLAQQNYIFNDIIEYDSIADAQKVKNDMNATIDEFTMVRVADLYEFSGVSCPSYTCNSYGWYNLDGVDIVPLMNGKWTLRLPDAVPLT